MKNIILRFTVFLLLLSCSNDDSNDAIKTTVYAAGINISSTETIATLWIDGKPTLLSDGLFVSHATSVYVSGNDVYVGGYESNGTKDVAKLWKNGGALNLSDGTNYASVKSVFIANTDVYASGYQIGSGSKLWKNAITTNLNQSSVYNTEANSVYVHGSDVYVAGYEANVSDNGYPYPALWINGERTYLEVTKVGGYLNSVFVTQN